MILFIGACVRIFGYPALAIRYDKAISLYQATIQIT
jgi:hypothetical protein